MEILPEVIALVCQSVVKNLHLHFSRRDGVLNLAADLSAVGRFSRMIEADPDGQELFLAQLREKSRFQERRFPGAGAAEQHGHHLAPDEPQQIDRVLLAAMGSHMDYNKLVVVVDEDVDIYNMEEVIWAFLTRGRADTRTMVVNNVAGFYRDPHKDHWGRLGLDATRPWGREAEFARKSIPGEADVNLDYYLPHGWR